MNPLWSRIHNYPWSSVIQTDLGSLITPKESTLGVFLLPSDRMLVHHRVRHPQFIYRYSFIHLNGERHCESNSWPVDPEYSTQAISSQCSNTSTAQRKVYPMHYFPYWLYYVLRRPFYIWVHVTFAQWSSGIQVFSFAQAIYTSQYDRCLLTDRLTDWLAHWLMDGWTDGRTDGLVDWLTGLLTDWRTDGLTDWRTDGLTDWRTDGLTDWRTDGLTDWLTDKGVLFFIFYFFIIIIFLLCKAHLVIFAC